MLNQSEIKELMQELMPNNKLNGDGLPSSQNVTKPHVSSGSLLMRSLSLLEEMLDNHQADAVQMSGEHYKEVKKLVKDIRKSKGLQ